MGSIHLSVDVKAPTRRVWDILTGLEDYGQWTDHYAFEGPLPAQGGTVKVRATQPDGKVYPVRFTFTEIATHARLAWIGGTRGIFRGSKRWRLESVGNSMTRVRMEEQFHGLIPMLAGTKLVRTFEPHYRTLCEQLKRHAESEA